MLVVLLVIQVSAVLLDTGVNSELGWIDLLASEFVVCQVVIKLAIIHDADFITGDVEIPVASWSLGVLLRRRLDGDLV